MSDIFRPGLLARQVAVVTGGGSGLGRATALELASLGARVVVCGRRAEPLAQTCALAREDHCLPVVCDARDEVAVDALVTEVLDRFGRLDLLVNNAGGQFLSPAEDISPKGFNTVVRLNLESAWLVTHAVATRAMIPVGRGKVVSITLSPHHGLPGMAHSSAARAGVENLMRVLSIEWARYGIRLNSIAAGAFATDAFVSKYPEPFIDGASSSVPLGRLGRPEEVAWLVAYLASRAGDYISGSVLTVDGARDDHAGMWPPASEADGNGRPLAEVRG